MWSLIETVYPADDQRVSRSFPILDLAPEIPVAPFKNICIAALTTFLVVVAGATAHHLYETHLSSGYAPILKAALQTTDQVERAQYIHQAWVAVRTDMDQESEAKLEKREADFDGETTSDVCRDWESAAHQSEHNWRASMDKVEISRSNDALEKQLATMEGRPYRASDTTALDLKSDDVREGGALKASEAYLACTTTNEKATYAEGFRLYRELCATAGIPAN
jgi:hypothetical protein